MSPRAYVTVWQPEQPFEFHSASPDVELPGNVDCAHAVGAIAATDTISARLQRTRNFWLIPDPLFARR